MTRLFAGWAAPEFAAKDVDGRTHSLGDYRGRYLLLSFYRFASCPLCNLRISQLVGRKEWFDSRGVDLLAVFHSPAKRIQRYVGRRQAPFPMVPDPERKLYDAYGVEASWLRFIQAFVLRAGTVLSAYRKGFFVGTFEGGLNGLPADFLIGPDGRVLQAYYGKDAGDHMPLDALDRIVAREETPLGSTDRV